MAETPKIGLIIVGDEILSGMRQDKHLGAVIERLHARGLHLSWVQMAGDDPDYLADMLSATFSRQDIVLCCGGIGGTPDDHTRQAAARALGRPIVRHPEAVALIEDRCRESGQPADEYRLRMADFPKDAELIPNPYNKIAGFTVNRHHFVPGFPVMAWPMIEWVLDTHYKESQHSSREYKQALLLFETPEARITPVMEDIEHRFSGCKLYSLPSVGDDKMARHIELGVKARGGEDMKAQVAQAFEYLVVVLNEMQCKTQLL